MLPAPFGSTDARVGATVVTVSIGVPLPPLTAVELRLHLGGTAETGVMAQLRFTVELKPPPAVTVTTDVAEPPAVMVAGDSGAAVSANADTVRLAVEVVTRFPEVAVIVKLKLPPSVDVVVVTVSGTLVF